MERKKMTRPDDNETWIIEEGDRIIRKKTGCGLESLTSWERLVYSLWVADYGMRNAGDLDTARNVHDDFQSIALQAAKELSLPLTSEAFSMEPDDLENEYFDRFDAICDEIKSAELGAAT
jgi:hypothetical protein